MEKADKLTNLREAIARGEINRLNDIWKYVDQADVYPKGGSSYMRWKRTSKQSHYYRVADILDAAKRLKVDQDIVWQWFKKEALAQGYAPHQ